MASVARTPCILLGFLALWSCRGPSDAPDVRITVPSGASVLTVADTLSSRGVINHPGLFRWYVKLSGHQRDLKAGVFDVSASMSFGEIVDVLVAGRPALQTLALPEGLMLTELAASVERQLGIPAAEFQAAASDSALRRRLGARGSTVEGYLYPNTYRVRVGATASEIVEQMVSEFEERWRPTWNARLDTLNLTRDELVTLASIIEGEARHERDRQYVSSVYHNRINRGMRLQADPTVIYALGVRRRLFERDYLVQSPFNTYQIDGLPPQPIGQPSEASILAALYPHATDFLYFVADSNGRHVFSRTHREHLAAIARIRGR